MSGKASNPVSFRFIRAPAGGLPRGSCPQRHAAATGNRGGTSATLPAMNEVDSEALEIRLAYLERSLQELGDAVYRQQRDIEMLRARLIACEQTIDARADSPMPAGEERPPHY